LLHPNELAAKSSVMLHLGGWTILPSLHKAHTGASISAFLRTTRTTFEGLKKARLPSR